MCDSAALLRTALFWHRVFKIFALFDFVSAIHMKNTAFPKV
jgi:hypothetical protein